VCPGGASGALKGCKHWGGTEIVQKVVKMVHLLCRFATFIFCVVLKGTMDESSFYGYTGFCGGDFKGNI